MINGKWHCRLPSGISHINIDINLVARLDGMPPINDGVAEGEVERVVQVFGIPDTEFRDSGKAIASELTLVAVSNKKSFECIGTSTWVRDNTRTTSYDCVINATKSNFC